MATIGRLDEFDPATDAVESYAERAQLFFEANDIAAGKQTAVFLSAIGTKTYQLLRDLIAPTLPKEKWLFLRVRPNYIHSASNYIHTDGPRATARARG